MSSAEMNKTLGRAACATGTRQAPSSIRQILIGIGRRRIECTDKVIARFFPDEHSASTLRRRHHNRIEIKKTPFVRRRFDPESRTDETRALVRAGAPALERRMRIMPPPLHVEFFSVA